MNGWQVVFPSDPRQAQKQYKNLFQENRRLRARVRELEQLIRGLRGRADSRAPRATRAVQRSLVGTASLLNCFGYMV